MISESVDHKRSWIIAIACSWIAFCNTGIYRSSSVLYVEMIKTLGLSRESASWPFSLFGAVSSFTGILPGLLSEKLEVKHFVNVGALLSTLGVLACALARDVAWITVAFGIVAGFGSGLIMTLLPVVINANFISNRATANGIFLSGSTISLLVLPSLTEWLVHRYALKGTFLLLSGLVLNVLVGAMFLKLPKKEVTLLKKPEVAEHIIPRNEETKSKTIYRLPNYNKAEAEYGERVKMKMEGNYDTRVNPQYDKPQTRYFNAKPEIENLQIKKMEVEKPGIEYFKINKSEKKNLQTYKPEAQISTFSNPELTTFVFNKAEIENCEFEKPEATNCKWRNEKLTQNSGVVSNDETYFQMKGPEQNKQPRCGRENYSNTLVKCSRTLFDPMFILITFSSVTTRTVIVTVSLILVDYVMDKGETEIEGVILVSVVAIPELVGRLGSGWISDHHFLKRKNVFLISEALSGVCLFLLTVVHSSFLIFTLFALFALANGGAFILVNVFYLEYLGLDRLPMALGLKNLFTGLASLTRPWLIGVFRDQVCSYDYLFQTLGVISVLAGAVWFLEPLLKSKNSPNNLSEDECI